MRRPPKRVAVGSLVSRRQVERLAIELPIAVRGPGRAAKPPERATTVDLSRGGISFRGSRKYRPGTKLHVTFLDTENLFKKGVEIPARVVRAGIPRTDPAGTIAVRFEDAARANLVLSELLRAKTRVSSALYGIIQALRPGAQVEEIIETICRQTETAMDAERALLFLRDPAGEVLRARVRQPEGKQEFEVKPGEGLVGQVLVSRRIANIPSVRADRRFRPEIEKYFDGAARSVLCVPLGASKGLPPGLLVVLNKRYGRFTAEDESLGAAVAHQISVVLREARLFEDIVNVRNYSESILQSISAGVSTFDPSGKLVTANHAASEQFSIQPQADVGKHFGKLLDEKANSRLFSLLEDALRTISFPDVSQCEHTWTAFPL